MSRDQIYQRSWAGNEVGILEGIGWVYQRVRRYTRGQGRGGYIRGSRYTRGSGWVYQKVGVGITEGVGIPEGAGICIAVFIAKISSLYFTLKQWK